MKDASILDPVRSSAVPITDGKPVANLLLVRVVLLLPGLGLLKARQVFLCARALASEILQSGCPGRQCSGSLFGAERTFDYAVLDEENMDCNLAMFLWPSAARCRPAFLHQPLCLTTVRATDGSPALSQCTTRCRRSALRPITFSSWAHAGARRMPV
jgi:hypothetical protein